MVTTIVRVHAKMIFTALSFNHALIRTFKHRGVMSHMLSHFIEEWENSRDFMPFFSGLAINIPHTVYCTRICSNYSKSARMSDKLV